MPLRQVEDSGFLRHPQISWLRKHGYTGTVVVCNRRSRERMRIGGRGFRDTRDGNRCGGRSFSGSRRRKCFHPKGITLGCSRDREPENNDVSQEIPGEGGGEDEPDDPGYGSKKPPVGEERENRAAARVAAICQRLSTRGYGKSPKPFSHRATRALGQLQRHTFVPVQARYPSVETSLHQSAEFIRRQNQSLIQKKS